MQTGAESRHCVGCEYFGKYLHRWLALFWYDHQDVLPQSIEAVIVQIADAISASRPGARRENLDTYIKRLEGIEKIAVDFKGVEKAYAIQAGREIRIIVKPDNVNDEMSWKIAKDLSKKIEEEMTYPGQIKVTVIRESRFVEYAK